MCVNKLCDAKLCVSKLCESKLCDDKLCVRKLYDDKLCVSNLCDDKLCEEVVCGQRVDKRRREEEEEADGGIQNQKQDALAMNSWIKHDWQTVLNASNKIANKCFYNLLYSNKIRFFTK